MDCPQCNRRLRVEATRCACGWVVPKESRLHIACAYIPCASSAVMSVKNKNGFINVCFDHYERWVSDGMEQGPTPKTLEERAREVARRFGVNENLSPRQRCLAIVNAFKRSGGIGGGYRGRMRERVPGEDDQ